MDHGRERAEFYGGGPADGARRPVPTGRAYVVLLETLRPLVGPDDEFPAHLYSRQSDGRYRYVGPVPGERRSPLV